MDPPAASHPSRMVSLTQTRTDGLTAKGRNEDITVTFGSCQACVSRCRPGADHDHCQSAGVPGLVTHGGVFVC